MSLDVLAIAAHPDDIEQTCGGTLIRMAETGLSYRGAGSHRRRYGHARHAGTARGGIRSGRPAICASAWRGNLRLPDARLENNIGARMTLAVKIRELQPRVVILPYWEARHPDHYRAANWVMKLASWRD